MKRPAGSLLPVLHVESGGDLQGVRIDLDDRPQFRPPHVQLFDAAQIALNEGAGRQLAGAEARLHVGDRHLFQVERRGGGSGGARNLRGEKGAGRGQRSPGQTGLHQGPAGERSRILAFHGFLPRCGGKTTALSHKS